MNKKAEIGIGVIIVVAMVGIIGAVFLTAIAQQVGEVVNTVLITRAFWVPINPITCYVHYTRGILS